MSGEGEGTGMESLRPPATMKRLSRGMLAVLGGAVAVLGAVSIALGASAGTPGRAPAADATSPKAPGEWRIRDLGALDGRQSWATALNERGQIVGRATTRGYGDPPHAFSWRAGKLTDIGTVGRDLGGDLPSLSEAVAVNERGDVLGNGSVNQNSPVSYAFMWRAGRMRVLTAPGAMSAGAFVYSVAEAINERGEVVGWIGSDVGYGKGRAFLWHEGRFTKLRALDDRQYSWASDVNERGQVVGWSFSMEGDAWTRTRAALWHRGRVVDLGVLPGATTSSAVAVNEHGHVLGASPAEDGPSRGFLWRGGKLIDLGRLDPIGLNDRGQVIGVSGRRAILWQGGRD